MNRTITDSKIHEYRSTLSGRSIAGAGLDVAPAVVAPFDINHRGGFQGGLDTFGTDTDKGKAQLPVFISGKFCRVQCVRALDT